jgi:hypothetical protein
VDPMRYRVHHETKNIFKYDKVGIRTTWGNVAVATVYHISDWMTMDGKYWRESKEITEAEFQIYKVDGYEDLWEGDMAFAFERQVWR